MIGDGGHGKSEVGKSNHNGAKYGFSHKNYALISDPDSLQIGSGGGGSSTY